MKQLKRIFALLLVAVLAALYISTLVFAATDNPKTMHMFGVSVVATIVLPVLLYIYQMIYKTATGRSKEVTEDLSKNILNDIAEEPIDPPASND